VTASTWIALAALLLAAASFGYTVWKGAQNAKAADKAQRTAEDANTLNKERLHAEVLRTPASTTHNMRGVSYVCFEITGKGPAHNIQIAADVTDDCPADQRPTVQEIIRQLNMKCPNGTTLGVGAPKDIASNPDQLRYVEVTNLTFEDEYGKPGRANALRQVENP